MQSKEIMDGIEMAMIFATIHRILREKMEGFIVA